MEFWDVEGLTFGFVPLMYISLGEMKGKVIGCMDYGSNPICLWGPGEVFNTGNQQIKWFRAIGIFQKPVKSKYAASYIKVLIYIKCLSCISDLFPSKQISPFGLLES